MSLDMEQVEFARHVREAQVNHPFWFEGATEQPASIDEIEQAERKLGAKFPGEYRQFLLNYPAGYFAHTNVFSVHTDSKWYIFALNLKIGLMPGFLVVSDDQCGGYYGFLVGDGFCGSEIYYKYISELDPPKKTYDSLFEYIAKIGLEI